MTEIARVHARQVLDCRGNPTVEAEVALESGEVARGITPAGKSRGAFEAAELRDDDPTLYRGMGVLKAVAGVNEIIAPALIGKDVSDQEGIDRLMIELDGTADKSRLGGNATVAVSMAVAKAAALAAGLPLYRHLRGREGGTLPLPLMHVVSGGLHAYGSVDFQEFQFISLGARTFSEAYAIGNRLYHATVKILQDEKGYGELFGDDGGLAPALASNEEVVAVMTDAIRAAGLRPREEAGIFLDVAATHFYRDGMYQLGTEDRTLDSTGMIDYLEKLCTAYPVLSIEDGLAEEDWEGWAQLTRRLGDRVQLIGDDLFVTNVGRIRKGIESGVANAVLIKVNQIGTVTETKDAIDAAKQADYVPVLSARSGETEETIIAHLAVGFDVNEVKFSGLRATEFLAKINELFRIEEELGATGGYAGTEPLARFL